MDFCYYEKNTSKLVSVPYEVPENWIWTSVGDIFELQAGKFITANDISNEQKIGTYPCYGGNGLRGYVQKYNQEGDYALIGRQGALCGNINRGTGKFYATEHAVVVTSIDDISAEFICMFLTAINLNQYATATAQPGLAVSKINKVLFPLPPLKEQIRIVKTLKIVFKLLKGEI